MKLVIISTNAGSLLRFRGNLISELVKKKVEVIALASDFDIKSREAIIQLGCRPIDINLSRTGINVFKDVFAIYHLNRVLRQIKPNISLGYFIKPVIFGTLASWWAGVPNRVAMIEGLGYIFTEDGQSPSFKKSILQRLVSFLYKIALARANKVVFLNSDDIKDFIRWGIVHKEKAIELGGIGIKLDEWPLIQPAISPLTFLFIGRLLKEKGIYDFIDSARLVKSRNQEVKFIVLGGLDSNPGGINEVQVKNWVNEGLIEWPGHVAVQPWLLKSSVFVLPSFYREGIPRSTQEAMAAGLPIITTNSPGCRETVVHGVNGFLVPVRNPVLLAEAMFKFIDDTKLIPKMGAESRKIAEERYDVHKVNQKLISILGL